MVKALYYRSHSVLPTPLDVRRLDFATPAL